MKPRLGLLALFLLLAASVLQPPPVAAQQDEATRRLRAQLRETQRMQQAAEESRRLADAAATAAEQALEAAREREEGLSAELAAVRNRALGASRESEQLRQRLTELEGRLAEEREQRALVETDFERYRRASATADTQRNEELAQCRRDNASLAQSARELLEAYAAKSVLEVLGKAEPFTGIGQVRLENLIERYRERIEDASPPAAAPEG